MCLSKPKLTLFHISLIRQTYMAVFGYSHCFNRDSTYYIKAHKSYNHLTQFRLIGFHINTFIDIPWSQNRILLYYIIH
jgi:hypothetical protein